MTKKKIVVRKIIKKAVKEAEDIITFPGPICPRCGKEMLLSEDTKLTKEYVCIVCGTGLTKN